VSVLGAVDVVDARQTLQTPILAGNDNETWRWAATVAATVTVSTPITAATVTTPTGTTATVTTPLTTVTVPVPYDRPRGSAGRVPLPR